MLRNVLIDAAVSGAAVDTDAVDAATSPTDAVADVGATDPSDDPHPSIMESEQKSL